MDRLVITILSQNSAFSLDKKQKRKNFYALTKSGNAGSVNSKKTYFFKVSLMLIKLTLLAKLQHVKLHDIFKEKYQLHVEFVHEKES